MSNQTDIQIADPTEENTIKPGSVMIGIACSKEQIPVCWRAWLGLQTPEAGLSFATWDGALTDMARNSIVSVFLRSRAEYLLFLDDDVEVPLDVIPRLLAVDKKEIVAGIYYRRSSPCDPLVYMRNEDGFYSSVVDWDPGRIIKVDAVGMGCTMIHRSVFERIADSHFLYQRAGGPFAYLPFEQVMMDNKRLPKVGIHVTEKGARLVTEVVPNLAQQMGPTQHLPFFIFDFGRTEDLYFCELAANAGVEVWVDTTIECEHWGHASVGRQQFEQVRRFMESQAEEQGSRVEFRRPHDEPSGEVQMVSPQPQAKMVEAPKEEHDGRVSREEEGSTDIDPVASSLRGGAPTREAS